MEKVALGQIRTSYGVHGELKVRSYSGDVEHWRGIPELTLRRKGREKTLPLKGLRRRGELWTIKLEGVDTPEAAKGFAAWEIWADKEYASPCGPGEFSCFQLSGAQVTFDGEVRGRVRGIVQGGAADLLEVETQDGSVKLVPFQEVFVGQVEPGAGKNGETIIDLKADWILES